VLELLREAADEYGQTIVMVTHDMRAAEAADGAIHVADGRVVGEEVTA
jgi:putative ABC transport system ATP-binding protein